MIKILVADDHLVVRKGIIQILSDSADMEVLDEAADGHEALAKAIKLDCDVVLLDISMPGKNGLEVLKEIKAQKPSLPVLMLSMYPEEQYAMRALKNGASGYLTKESAPDELTAALRKVSNGGKYVTLSLAEKLAFRMDDDAGSTPHENLSDREFQVLCMMAQGSTISDVADKLNLSVKTISTYRTRILEKMGMSNNAELTHYAIKNGLVE
jgi:DNA-binding NarL/FixJ family response regulator